MKLSNLTDRFNKLSKKKDKGKKIKPKKIAEVQKLLAEKKSNYEKKLKAKLDADKRKSLEIKLKVVNAQLKKTQKLLAKD